MAPDEVDKPTGSTLGEHLALLRAARNLTLREVEQATGKVVSNAYLSQIENNKINKPSPNILYALAEVYCTSYEDLMTRAGYLTSEPKQARVAAFAVEVMSEDEQKALLEYLAYFRHQQRKRT